MSAQQCRLVAFEKSRLAPVALALFAVATMATPGALGQELPDLFTVILPGFSFILSTNQVFQGGMLTVEWQGYNNSSNIGIPEGPPPVQIFGPAYGPWQDAVFLVGGFANRLLATATFDGVLGPGGAYTSEATFQIPYDCAPGVYGLEIYIDYSPTNSNGVVREQNESNNAAVADGALVILSALSFTGGIQQGETAFQLQLSGSITQAFRIQACSSLTQPIWSDLGAFSSLQGTIEYVDRSATNKTARFYRLVSP